MAEPHFATMTTEDFLAWVARVASSIERLAPVLGMTQGWHPHERGTAPYWLSRVQIAQMFGASDEVKSEISQLLLASLQGDRTYRFDSYGNLVVSELA